MERTIQARPMEARLGGDPSVANKVRAFVAVRHYRSGEWEDRIEVREAYTQLVTVLKRLLEAGRWSTIVGEAVLHGPYWPPARGFGRSSEVPNTNQPSRANLPNPLPDVGRVRGQAVSETLLPQLLDSRTDVSLPKTHRDQLHSVYNAHMLHSSTTDPFKLALYKLMGKIDPTRRSVAQVTVTIEDWLWFQLAMVCTIRDFTSYTLT